MGTSEKELLHSYPGHSLLQSISSGLNEDDDAYNRIEQSPAPLSNKPDRQIDRQTDSGSRSGFIIPARADRDIIHHEEGPTQAVADQFPHQNHNGLLAAARIVAI